MSASGIKQDTVQEAALNLRNPVHLGDLVFDRINHCLSSPSGSTISLTHQASEVLHQLTLKTNGLVTRDELIESIWDGNFLVGSTRLYDEIWKLREALKACGDSSIQILTIPRKGYSLILTDASEQTRSSSTGILSHGAKRARAVIVGIGFLALILVFMGFRGQTTATLDQKSAAANSYQSVAANFLDALLDPRSLPPDAERRKALGPMLEKAERALFHLDDQPLAQAEVLKTLARQQFLRANMEEANRLIRESQVLIERELGKESTEWLSLETLRGKVLRNQGNRPEADAVFLNVLATYERMAYDGPEVSELYLGLANLRLRAGDYPAAEAFFEAAVASAEYGNQSHKEQLAWAVNGLAFFNHYAERYPQALSLYDRAKALFIAEFGETQRAHTGPILSNQADVYLRMGQLETARATSEAALQHMEVHYPSDHLAVGRAAITHAKICVQQGEAQLATHYLSLGEEILAAYPAWVTDIYFSRILLVKGELLALNGDLTQARQLVSEGLAGYIRYYGADHPLTRYETQIATTLP